MTKIHRNSGHVELYSADKLKEGVIHACLAVGTPVGAAEQFAKQVEKKVAKVILQKSAVSSRDLKRLVKNALNSYNPDAAEVYAVEEEF